MKKAGHLRLKRSAYIAVIANQVTVVNQLDLFNDGLNRVRTERFQTVTKMSYENKTRQTKTN